MKNIVLCFDHADEHPGSRDATNTQALFGLLDSSDQINWYHPGAGATARTRRSLPRRGNAVTEARSAIVEAYDFLRDSWEPGDHLFLFGGGYGGHRACELAALLGTVGLLPNRSDELLDYALATYVLPRTTRTAQDWQRVSKLTAQLLGDDEAVVPVRFLGMWDAKAIPGVRGSAGLLSNVETGRHAVAVGGGRRAMRRDSRLDEVWFRGAHCDIAGGAGACWPLADIALDWMIDGAVEAGLQVFERNSSPSDADALAGSAQTFGVRRPPLDARVHASVEVYLRSHPQYWRRLPARIEWADTDWLSRGERLVPTAVEAPAEGEVLTAAAS
ncbi:phospholipase effector Tle1 domain-containing protein [Mycolicibacterium wolinskyi]|uniref:phospholipase effector Tle1 domain-containing protein n=1 Tax=Mycolicibacterium wolinskyi TaxID=59750 RepID=UPI0039178B65